MKRTDSNEEFLGFVCTYEYTIIPKEDEEWKRINTINGNVFTAKGSRINKYNFTGVDTEEDVNEVNDEPEEYNYVDTFNDSDDDSDDDSEFNSANKRVKVDDKYEISNYGRYKNGINVFECPVGESIQKSKKQFCGYSNARLFYLAAIAFADNPNNYSSAILKQEGTKIDKFFTGFRADNDIAWVPNRHNIDTSSPEINYNNYTFKYYIEEIEELPNLGIVEVPNAIEKYDSYKDSILEDTWTPIKGYPRYEIDKRGHIRNATSKQIRKCHINTNGYYSFTVYPERKRISVHRLVALTFLPEPDRPDQICVNHISGCKLNNSVTDDNLNLEWASYSENNKHMCQVLHPDRIFMVMRKNVKSVRNNKSFESLIRYNLLTNKQLSGILVDHKRKKIIVNEYIYKPELQFDSTQLAAQYFAQLGFPDTNVIPFNIGINKYTFGYTWSYTNDESSSSISSYLGEIWIPLDTTNDSVYAMSELTDVSVSNYGRMKKKDNIINILLLKSESKIFKINGKNKEFKIAALILIGNHIPRPTEDHNAHIMNTSGNKYHPSNLSWYK
jgi:hypothetical protein